MPNLHIFGSISSASHSVNHIYVLPLPECSVRSLNFSPFRCDRRWRGGGVWMKSLHRNVFTIDWQQVDWGCGDNIASENQPKTVNEENLCGPNWVGWRCVVFFSLLLSLFVYSVFFCVNFDRSGPRRVNITFANPKSEF